MVRDMVSAERIKSARELLGETQWEFAARFRVNQSTIARWESNSPPKRGVVAIAVEHVLSTLPLPEQSDTGSPQAQD